MMSLNEIRAAFLRFFEREGHEAVPSGPLVPRNDPTLLFTNAGMVPFKNVFTGAEKRPYTRAVSAQKCVRAGGKHNDLDNVGYTARHHTFFEMLGNFSFGDYFKEEAIDLAWRLITREFAISPERLLVTVHAEDEEAAALWRKVAGLPEDRIIRIGTSDNFWSMGDTGPCGPCSEIFFDHGPEIPGGPPGSPDEDGDRFVEIWNLVFMQFEQLASGERVALPKPSIDTGMGLERIGAVLQGTHDNYDTDLFRKLIATSVEATGTPAEGAHRASHRVIADHLRASGFLIADGILPSNEGRGYVLRRIMRRGMRHAHLLGAEEPLMHRLVPALITEMGEAYPELHRARPLITETLKLEETRFRRTLERGLKLLEEETGKLGGARELPGEVAFRLYDTYGFPFDLTEDALRARGIGVDRAGFEKAMARQREEARKAWAGSGEAATEEIWFALHERLGATDFLGYATERADGSVTALVADGAEIPSAGQGQEAALIANQTPFYAESGGQVGDTGTLTGPHGVFEVTDTQKKADGLFVHLGTVKEGEIRVGDTVDMRVDSARRSRIRANHSATHLLHEALRRTLGEHVTQKGSLVAPDRLRFDISHPKPLTAGEIEQVEAEVNRRIRENTETCTRFMTPDEAMEAGALALFGEKYGDEVRVLIIPEGDGNQEAEGSEAPPFSVELCGGTHVRRTGDIALFKIVAESAVSAGVRRIEALTGQAALDYLNDEEHLLQEAASVLKTPPTELPARLEALVRERRKLERELADARKAAALGGGAGAQTGSDIREAGGIRLIARRLDGIEGKDLPGLVDDAKKRLGSGVAAFVSVSNGKPALIVGVTDDLTGRFDAVELVRAAAGVMGGKGGGGRPDMARAGGADPSRSEAALEEIARRIEAQAAPEVSNQ
ncbi:MAG: alanine--tRNA ligase [Alphaproteobacteria bacterium]